MKITAWHFVNFMEGTCAVVISAPVGSGNNLSLTPAAARELATQLNESADFIDSLLEQKGLVTSHEKAN